MCVNSIMTEPPADTFKPSSIGTRLADVEHKTATIAEIPNIVQSMREQMAVLTRRMDADDNDDIRSGASLEHEVAPLSSGTLYCVIPEKKPVKVLVVSLFCSDDLGGIMHYTRSITEDNILSVSVENLLDKPRMVKINFLYQTIS